MYGSYKSCMKHSKHLIFMIDLKHNSNRKVEYVISQCIILDYINDHIRQLEPFSNAHIRKFDISDPELLGKFSCFLYTDKLFLTIRFKSALSWTILTQYMPKSPPRHCFGPLVHPRMEPLMRYPSHFMRILHSSAAII